MELMRVSFPVGTHGVYQRHLRSFGQVEKAAWHLRGCWPGEWMAAAWQETWHEGWLTLWESLEAQPGDCGSKWL